MGPCLELRTSPAQALVRTQWLVRETVWLGLTYLPLLQLPLVKELLEGNGIWFCFYSFQTRTQKEEK